MKRFITAAMATAGLLTSAAALAQEGPFVGTDKAEIDGNKVTKITVNARVPGYLVIHDNAAGAPPNSLGHLRVPTGLMENVVVEADGPLDPANNITIMLHEETNGNDTYDFGPGSTDVDTPVSKADGVINKPVTAVAQ